MWSTLMEDVIWGIVKYVWAPDHAGTLKGVGDISQKGPHGTDFLKLHTDMIYSTDYWIIPTNVKTEHNIES